MKRARLYGVLVVLLLAAAAILSWYVWNLYEGAGISLSDGTQCVVDADCAPAQCCHPTSCEPAALKTVCTELCTQVCSGPMDCGAGHCGCVDEHCRVVAGSLNIVNTRYNPDVGSYLADAKGLTLYIFLSDKSANSTSAPVSACTGGCLVKWPVFNVSSYSVPSILDPLDFSSFVRPDGTVQAEYRGWPLYYFYNDTAPGETFGQGVGKVWYVATPDLRFTEPSMTTTTAALPSTITIFCVNSACAPSQVPAGAGTLAQGCYRIYSDCINAMPAVMEVK